MALPPSLAAQGTAWPVEGRQGFQLRERIRFGTYEATDVSRGWTRSMSLQLGPYGRYKAGKRFEFTLREPDAPAWQATCATDLDHQSLSTFISEVRLGVTVGLTFKRSFTALLQREGGGTPWKLLLVQGASDPCLHGVLTDGVTSIAVAGTQALEGSPIPLGEASGYVFSVQGEPIGAVEVINDGAVWLLPGAAPDWRSTMAAASAALLLYRELK
jgi:hypothetical protein